MKTTNYILQPGLHPPTQAYHVFDRSRNQHILNCLHLVPLFTGASVLYCGRAMQVGIIGGAALGRRVVVPAGPVWSWPAPGAISLVLAVVVVCTGVLAAGLLIHITLFCAVALLYSLLSLENPKGLLDEINN